MKLDAFDRKGDAVHGRYVARIADAAGAEDYELVVAGTDGAVRKIFGDTDFEVTIDTSRSFETGDADELAEDFKQRHAGYLELAALENMDTLFKPQPQAASPKNTVFASLRRIRGNGTFWGPFTFPFVLPRLFSIWVWPPPTCTLTATVRPASGDQDLYLYRFFNPWSAGIIDASLHGGTTPDTVGWSNPPLTPCNFTTWMYGVVRIYGYATGAGAFTYRGFS